MNVNVFITHSAIETTESTPPPTSLPAQKLHRWQSCQWWEIFSFWCTIHEMKITVF